MQPPMVDPNGQPLIIPTEELPVTSVVAEDETSARQLVANRIKMVYGMSLVEVLDDLEGQAPGVVFIKRADGLKLEAPELQQPQPVDPTA
jgi:hypothetical protein